MANLFTPQAKDFWLFWNPSLNIFAISQSCIHFRPLWVGLCHAMISYDLSTCRSRRRIGAGRRFLTFRRGCNTCTPYIAKGISSHWSSCWAWTADMLGDLRKKRRWLAVCSSDNIDTWSSALRATNEFLSCPCLLVVVSISQTEIAVTRGLSSSLRMEWSVSSRLTPGFHF